MKNLVITGVYPPLPAAESDYGQRFCRELEGRGEDVAVVSRAGSELYRTPGLLVKDWRWSSLLNIRRYVAQYRPDRVYLLYIGWIYDRHPAATFIPWVVKQVLPAVPVVTVMYNRIGAEKARMSWATTTVRDVLGRMLGAKDTCYEFGTLFSQSDHVACLSQKHLDYLAQVHPELADKSSLLPALPLIEARGVDRTVAREALGYEPRDFVVTYLGYVYPGKGLEDLFEAFRALSISHPRVCLNVIGGDLMSQRGEYRVELKEKLKRLGIQSHVHWIEKFRSDDLEVKRRLAATDVGVLPFEVGLAANNSSVATLMSFGVPVLSTRGPKTESFFEDKTILVSPHQPRELAAELKRLYLSPRLRGQLSTASIELSQTRFDWTCATDHLIQVAQSAANLLAGPESSLVVE